MSSRLRSLILAVSITVWGLALSAIALVWRNPAKGMRAGDAEFDSIPAVETVSSGRFWEMYSGDDTPLMMPLGILARIPGFLLSKLGVFDGLAYEGIDGSRTQRYLDFDVAVLGGVASTITISAIVVAAAVWMASAGMRTRMRALWTAAASAVFILNPFTMSAAMWGHEEEILMTALIAGGLLAFYRSRWVMGAVLIALACATKQPALILVPLAFFMIPREARLRASAWGAGVFAVATLPFISGGIGRFLAVNIGISSDDITITGAHALSRFSVWPMLSSPAFDVFEANAKIIITLLAAAVAVLVAWRHRWQIPVLSGAFAVIGIMAARSLLDPVNIVYYALPVLAGALVIDLIVIPERWRVIPYFTLVVSMVLAVGDGKGLFILTDPAGLNKRHVFVVFLAILAVAGLTFALRKTVLAPVAAERATLRTRLVLWSVLGVALIGALVMLRSDASRNANKLPDLAVAGWVESEDRAVAAAPVPTWWLGERPLPDGALAFVGTFDRNAKSHLAQAKADRYRISYATVGGSALISVFASAERAPQALADLAACRTGACPAGVTMTRTPAGEAVLKEEIVQIGSQWGTKTARSWTAIVPRESGTVSVASLNGPAPAVVLPMLTRFNTATPGQLEAARTLP